MSSVIPISITDLLKYRYPYSHYEPDSTLWHRNTIAHTHRHSIHRSRQRSIYGNLFRVPHSIQKFALGRKLRPNHRICQDGLVQKEIWRPPIAQYCNVCNGYSKCQARKHKNNAEWCSNDCGQFRVVQVQPWLPDATIRGQVFFKHHSQEIFHAC